MTYIQIVRGRMATGVKVVFMKDEGVTATDYGVIAALIAVVDIAANSLLGTELKTTFTANQQALSNVNSGGG